jgi:putative inorganic carbon (HCO3(-)) transporter
LWVAPLTWVLAGLSLVGVRRKDVSFWKASLLTIFLTGLALTMSLTLMFLFSRAAQASYLIIMFLLFARLAWKQRWLIIVGIIGVIAIGWFLASSPEYQLRVEQFLLTISGETTGGSTAVESLTGRNEIWNRAYYTIRDFPLTGVGMNNFPAVMTKYFPAFAIRNTSDVTHAHNQLLIIGTDLGVPGIIAYVALMLGILLMLWQSWRRAPRLWDKMLVIGFAASLTAFELFGLFDGIGLGEKPAVFFWFLLGLSGGLFHLIHQPTLPKSTILPK